MDKIITDPYLHFALKDLEILHYFLGVQVTYSLTGMHLS